MQLAIGDVLEGKVTGITKFGAFVELPEGKTGMVHISEVSTAYVEDISQYLKQDQIVKVKVINIGEDGKIGLSIKRTLPPPERPARGPRGPRPAQQRGGRADTGRVWQPKAPQPQGDLSFEDMMARWKSQSEEKNADLKRVTEAHRGGGSRRR